MSDVFRNLVRAGLNAATWIDRTDASRNAAFGYNLGRLLNIGGSANSITADLLFPQGFTALQDGALLWFEPDANNTGPVEIDIEGIGPIAIRTRDGAALDGDELVAGRSVLLGYVDGSPPELRIMIDVGAGIAGLVGLQILTATGTYTPTAGTTKVWAILQGPGGGGGSTNTAKAGNGGAGETRTGVFEVTGNVSAVLPNGGTGAASGNTAGATPSDAEFGAFLLSKAGTGGGGGSGGANGSTPTGSGGFRINPAHNPIKAIADELQGSGGSPPFFGTGGQQRFGAATTSGLNAGGYGAGGAGGGSGGGNGSGSILVLLEFGQ